jgi:hypothetical protein
MNAPKHTAVTANHGASGCSRITAGRAGSRSNVSMNFFHRDGADTSGLPEKATMKRVHRALARPSLQAVVTVIDSLR